jgi:hypothetical protein
MINLLKHHWFGLILGLFVVLFGVMTVLIMIAPKQDVQGRGFIPCTLVMIDELGSCERKVYCSIKAITKNSWCDFKVIGSGMLHWLKGNQARPWSNYIFTPQLPEDGWIDKDARAEYLKQYPNTLQEMQKLKQLGKELENEQNNISIDESQLPKKQ